jgi:hypothetical protein
VKLSIEARVLYGPVSKGVPAAKFRFRSSTVQVELGKPSAITFANGGDRRHRQGSREWPDLESGLTISQASMVFFSAR